MSKYKDITGRITDFDIEKFFEDYKLKDTDQWALHKIRKSLGGQKDLEMKSLKASMKLLEMMRDCLATLEARWNNCSVYLIKGPIKDIVDSANECKNLGCLENNIKPEIAEIDKLYNEIKVMDVNTIIGDEQRDKILNNLDTACNELRSML